MGALKKKLMLLAVVVPIASTLAPALQRTPCSPSRDPPVSMHTKELADFYIGNRTFVPAVTIDPAFGSSELPE